MAVHPRRSELSSQPPEGEHQYLRCEYPASERDPNRALFRSSVARVLMQSKVSKFCVEVRDISPGGGREETATRDQEVARSGSEVVTKTSEAPYEYSNHDGCGDVGREWTDENDGCHQWRVDP